MTAMMNASKRARSAHPLFPPNQPFLWLPGFAGDERPYCTYNEYREHPAGFDIRRFNHLPERDDNGACFIPPFPVSPETHISWHTNVTPPFPYHPVPLARTLSEAELDDLGRRVLRLIGEDDVACRDPRAILRNDQKSYILVALAAMQQLPLGEGFKTAS